MRKPKENETRGASDRNSRFSGEKKSFIPKGPSKGTSDSKYSKKSESGNSGKKWGSNEKKDFSDYRRNEPGTEKRFGSRSFDSSRPSGSNETKRPRKFDDNSGPDKRFEKSERGSSNFNNPKNYYPAKSDSRPSYPRSSDNKTDKFSGRQERPNSNSERDFRGRDSERPAKKALDNKNYRGNDRFDKDNNLDKRDFKPRFNDSGDKRDFKPRFNDSTEKREFKPRFNDSDEKREFKPRFNESAEKREFKPRFKDSTEKRDFKPRFNDSTEKREFKPRFNDSDEKREFKPRFNDSDEKREFKPRFKESDDKRSFSREERPPFQSRNENPQSDRRDFKPRYNDSDKKRDFEKNNFRPSADDNRSEKRDFKGKFSEKSTYNNESQNPRNRNSQEDSSKGWFLDKTGDHERSRQVGLKQKPDYDNLKENLPPKLRSKVDLVVKKENGFFRLNRFLANAGLCSRREADEMIASGQITVNGTTVTEMGYQVKATDVVKYGRKILNREKLIYLLLNKPKDFVTTTEDPEGRKTVMDLVKNACTERIYPVGRLDRNTTGLLLLTNDGELADKLTHPSNKMKKIYQVELDKPIVQADFDKILEGLDLEDGFIKADDLSVITPDHHVVGIEIHSGRNRIVRRIFESLGYEVTKLDRTTFAGLTKKDLPRGNWRFLTEKEVIRLKYLI